MRALVVLYRALCAAFQLLALRLCSSERKELEILQYRGGSRRPYAGQGTERQRSRRALGAHRPRGMPRLAPDRRPPPARASASTYIDHYNRERPHRARGLIAPHPPDKPMAVADTGPVQVRRKDRLGGLLHEYERAA
jgi:hypothetical protein